jgi:kynurenine formamidase
MCHVCVIEGMKERQVNEIAVDTLSLDHGPTKDSADHYAWLLSGRYGIEKGAKLSRLQPVVAKPVAGASKFKGLTGGPGRVMAFA